MAPRANKRKTAQDSDPEPPKKRTRRMQKNAELEPTPTDSGDDEYKPTRKKMKRSPEKNQSWISKEAKRRPTRKGSDEDSGPRGSKKRQSAANGENDKVKIYMAQVKKSHTESMEELVAFANAQKNEVNNMAHEIVQNIKDFRAKYCQNKNTSTSVGDHHGSKPDSPKEAVPDLHSNQEVVFSLCRKALRLYNQLDAKTKEAKIDMGSTSGANDEAEMLEMIKAAQQTGFTLLQGAVFPAGSQKYNLPPPKTDSQKVAQSWFQKGITSLATSARDTWGLQKNFETILKEIEQDRGSSVARAI